MSQGDLQDQLAIFGRFQFEFSTGQLRKDGTRLRVEDKPARLLSMLLNRAGTVVRREELQNLLWPDGVHVDYDHGLNNSVNKLRAVLSDDPDDPRFIETLPRLGYRFIGPIEIVASGRVRSTVASSAPHPDPVTNPLPVPSPGDSSMPGVNHRNRRLWTFIAWTIALAAVVAIGASLLNGSQATHLVRQMLVSGKTFDPTEQIHSLNIEKNGALDPLDEGFKLFRPDDAHYTRVLYNRESNGWDRWRIVTDDQNYYYRPLSAVDKDFALHRDWKLTCVCALESGGGFADIDFGQDRGAPRFDIEFLQEGNKYFVALERQISPNFQWDQKIEFPASVMSITPTPTNFAMTT